MTFKNLALFAILSLLVFGCDSNRFFEQNLTIPEEKWDFKNRMVFNVPVEDTVSTFNFFLNLRNRKTYPYSNFYFFFHTVSPSGRITKDTVHCILTSPSGKWLGSSAGDIVDNKILFKTNTRFEKPGNYRFELEQAMREEELPSIVDAGLRIEKIYKE